MTLTENSSVVTNNTHGPPKYGTKTITVVLLADGEAS